MSLYDVVTIMGNNEIDLGNESCANLWTMVLTWKPKIIVVYSGDTTMQNKITKVLPKCLPTNLKSIPMCNTNLKVHGLFIFHNQKNECKINN
jgi:hypothetical protein